MLAGGLHTDRQNEAIPNHQTPFAKALGWVSVLNPSASGHSLELEFTDDIRYITTELLKRVFPG